MISRSKFYQPRFLMPTNPSSCELPRPKIACYKKVFANVKELQHELKERYWGEFCRWRSTVVCTWNEIKETNDGLSPSRIDDVASEFSCTPKVIGYFNHVPLFSPLKDSRFLGYTPFSHPCLVVLWVHRSSAMMTFPGPWSKRNGQPVSSPSRRSPILCR